MNQTRSTQTKKSRGAACHTFGQRFGRMGFQIAFAAVLLTGISPVAGAAEERARFEITNASDGPIWVQLRLYDGELVKNPHLEDRTFLENTNLAKLESIKWKENFKKCGRVKSGQLWVMANGLGVVDTDIVVRTIKQNGNRVVVFETPNLTTGAVRGHTMDVARAGNTLRIAIDN